VLLSKFDLNNVNFWNKNTCTIDGTVTDVVTLNYGQQRLELHFKFPRSKGMCYFESFRDYAETFSKVLGYMQLEHQLREALPHLEHIYSHTELLYG
jgi:hypothetical protein